MRSRWPWLVCAVSILIALAATTLLIIGAAREPLSTEDLVFLPVLVLAIVGYSTVGAILASRNTRNPIGWVLLTVGLAFGWAQATQIYAEYTLRIDPGALPFGRLAAWVGTWVYAIVFSALPLLALLFPSGRVASPRWRRVAWAVVAFASVAAIGTAFGPGSMEVETGFAVDNPLGLEALGPILELMGGIGWIGVLASIPVSIASLVLRFRRSQGEERQQIRWLVFVALAILVLLLAAIATALILGERYERSVGPQLFFGVIFSLIAVGVPAALGVAVLRYRLYDLDLVIKKTVVYGILAVLLFGGGTAVAWAAAGFLFWDRGGEGDAYSFLVTGLVIGVAVWPLRRLATRIANRLVYGRRATPYQVLTEFSGRLAESYSADDVLERMAQVLAAAVGAESATVWLLSGDRSRPGATWPPDASPGTAPPADAIEVRHQGEALGALSARMPAREPMTPSKERLIRDLAAQAGLVLRNAGLIEDLKASRQRIVAAQDERAKKLERNIHDGAQQQLVALAVKLGLVERLLRSDREKAETMLSEVKGEANDALENLRDLARGIYPPLLADQGLAAALTAQARKVSIPVDVLPDGIGRYPEETEAAVYFSCLEALQNVTKYAGASHVTVRLSQANGSLRFEVSDDGRGFDPSVSGQGSGLQGIADRLASLGGSVEIRSAPSHGTTVAGRVPVTETGP
ncbi:MAG TPA: sensor histidine kinase [Actinomycetota bacterium]|nr:sensor histidine kinase [Actinomycetota bacterium]